MTYISKRKPREKQAQALKLIEGRKTFALLMAMRTGKTKVVLDDWGRLVYAGKVKDLLVIAPGGVYKTWSNDNPDNPGAIYADLPEELLKRTMVHTWRSGTYGSKKTKADLDRFLSWSGPRILVVNVEALSSVKLARETCEKFLSGDLAMIAIDESTCIKNPKAERTKYVLRHLRSRSGWRRILSGLPTPQSLLDLYTQFEFLDAKILGFNSFYTFRARYAIMKQVVMGGRSFQIVAGFRDEADLQKKIAPHSFRVRLEDCYDLPPSMYSIRYVSMTKDQERIYNELKEFASAKLAQERYVTATMVITQLLRMHQVLCGHTSDENGELISIKENRTSELIDLLEEYDGKAIIWCSYDHDVRKVSEALNRNFSEKDADGNPILFPVGTKGSPVARFWGGNEKTREDEERIFKTDSQCRFMVATPDAGKYGRTWDMADLVIYYSTTNDLEKRSQSEERPKGVGKTKSIMYVDMMCEGTVEEKIIKALRAKINMATAITGDNYREWLI